MKSRYKLLSVAVVMAASGCAMHSDRSVFLDGDHLHTGTGMTISGGAGSVSGGSSTSNGAEKEQRGNTPPGIDRDGHGPAAGAIVDPTGAATRTKP